jgi:hypothetical protein
MRCFALAQICDGASSSASVKADSRNWIDRFWAEKNAIKIKDVSCWPQTNDFERDIFLTPVTRATLLILPWMAWNQLTATFFTFALSLPTGLKHVTFLLRCSTVCVGRGGFFRIAWAVKVNMIKSSLPGCYPRLLPTPLHLPVSPTVAEGVAQIDNLGMYLRDFNLVVTGAIWRTF